MNCTSAPLTDSWVIRNTGEGSIVGDESFNKKTPKSDHFVEPKTFGKDLFQDELLILSCCLGTVTDKYGKCQPTFFHSNICCITCHCVCLYSQEREMGQRLNIIFVSEGAIDIKGNPITATQVQQVR